MQTPNWYAIKAFYNRSSAICDELRADGIETYHQDIIPAYLFARCTSEEIKALRLKLWERAFVYSRPGEKEPTPVPEKEMTTFILVTSMGNEGLTYLGDDKPEYHQGDLVRVIGGPFKGAEGHIKRIKKDRKLIVSINGVAAVAVAFIPPQMLERIE